MALIKDCEESLVALSENLITPTKSPRPRVLMTLVAAYLAIERALPDIDPDTSMIKTMFFEPEVAATYQGRNLGS